MGAVVSQLISLLLTTCFSVAMGLLWIRFLLQLVQADFYNPISQIVIKITSPVLNPLRQILPTRKNWDIAPLVVIFLLELLQITLLAMVNGFGTVPPLMLVFSAVFQLMFMLTQFYFVLLIISVVLSWISPGYSPFGALIAQLTEPVLAPLRRVLPPVGGLDLSPILAFLSIQVVQIILSSVLGHIHTL